MMTRSAFAGTLLLSVVVLACGEQAREVPPEVRERREFAYRIACASRTIAERAAEDRELLEETTAAADPSTPEGSMTLSAGGAVLAFARAYGQHAELRATIYAHFDSAANHAATAADSARYVQRADAFATRPPTEGTVEANAAAAFDRNLDAMLNDEDHPCNWDLPF